MNNCVSVNGTVNVVTSSGVYINDLDHCDRFIGVTVSTTPYYAVTIATKCSNIVVDGMTFGMNGTEPRAHPYSGIASITASTNVSVRNIGTRAVPLGSSIGRNQIGLIYASGGNNANVRLQRIYISQVRTGLFTDVNSDKNVLYEHLFAPRLTTNLDTTLLVTALNAYVKGCNAGTNTVTGQTSVYGTHWADFFLTDTTGRLLLSLNEATAETSGQVTVVSGSPQFTSAGGLSMPTLGDQVVIEMPYFCIGHSGLANIAPTLTGTNTGNHTFEYAIDTGSGFGTYKTLNATNLSGETISPSTGFKMRYRITTATANTGNLISFVRIDTASTLTNQSNNLYPLDTITLEITGLKNPTEIRVFNAGTTTEVAGQESVTSGTFSAAIDAGSYPAVDISILSLGYQNIRLLNIDVSTGDVSIPVQQQIDRQYANA